MKGNRLVRVIVFVLAFIGIAAAVRRGLLLGHILPPQNLPKYPGFDSGFAKHPALTFFHIIPGAFFMILGPFLFAKKVQANETLYKRLRTFFFINAYLTGITALAMSYTTSIGGAN